MKYKVEARLGRVTLTGYTTQAMHALLVAGQTVGRDFLEHYWDEFMRSTCWEDREWWSGHGSSVPSGWQKASHVTQEYLVRAV